MAAMDQGKLNVMCTKINNSAEEYVTQVGSLVNELRDAFNNNWVSTSSRELVLEISECLDSLSNEIIRIFGTKNDEIAKAVANFNMVEQENISYPGFSFSKPAVAIELNATLPSGMVGVAEGADLDSINGPMTNFVTNVTNIIGSIVTAIQNAEAFSGEEQQALAASINNIKTSFNSEMNELANSLRTRMSEEIDARSNLENANSDLLN